MVRTAAPVAPFQYSHSSVACIAGRSHGAGGTAAGLLHVALPKLPCSGPPTVCPLALFCSVLQPAEPRINCFAPLLFGGATRGPIRGAAASPHQRSWLLAAEPS